ncbi:M24 family metallopeptidase [Mycobacterium sp. smrl_JER01]|uniref:M24 family metallopeptidase n=1 Tax=Mycobacterium sp. smrl_JER01 TaxID=3402633 RepID=UPI003AC3A8BF
MQTIATAGTLRFDVVEYQARVAGYSRLLGEHGVDVYLGSSPEHMNYLTGFDPLGLYFFQVVVLRAGDEQPTLLTHKCEAELARTGCWINDIRLWQHGEDPIERTLALLAEAGVAPGSVVGLDMDSWYLKAATVAALRHRLPDTEFVDVTKLGLEQRMVKSPAEIEYMRAAAHMSDIAFEAAVDAIAPGTTENEVLAAVQIALARAGSEYPALPFIIGAGARSGLFHGVPTDNVIGADDPVMLEFAGVKARYNCNIVRTVVAGRASAELHDLYRIVTEAFERGCEAIRPGEPVGTVDAVTRRVRAGYEDYIPSRCGFGMGLAYPPVWLGLPDLLEGDEHVFVPGMVVSLEPSIAQYRGISVIYGKNVLVTETGHEVLQQAPTTIFEVVRT